MGVGDRLLCGGPRQVHPEPSDGASDCPYSRHGPTRLDTSCGPIDPPAEPNTPIWPNLVNRPGPDLYTGPCEKPAGAHRGSFALVPSTLRGLNALRLPVWAVRQKEDDGAILPHGVFELGARIR